MQCIWNEVCVMNIKRNWQEQKTTKTQQQNTCWREYYEKKEKQWSKKLQCYMF